MFWGGSVRLHKDLKFDPRILAFIGEICLQQQLLCNCLNFCFPHSFYIIWNSSDGKICTGLSPNLFTCSFVSVWIHDDLFFPLGCNPIQYFVAHILLALAIWHLCSFDMSPFSFFGAYFLVLQDASVSSCIFPVSAPRRIRHFSKEPWFLLLEKNI